MTKLYGDRWKLVGAPPLGQGGQSQVFRVVDARGEYGGEFALKRVLNPARKERFRNEIDAIKCLDHPNIMKLVDHSGLDASARSDKQFLVMPVAEGGDLSRSDRLSVYKGSIEAVLKVAKQIASGLKAAHDADIIHRDIKPQNILFPGIGHDIWITDFGICLIEEQQRSTETGEVVGPRAFMAPELEDGGRLDVSPVADVYSLGKVIYYMISGGVVIPRERLHEETYSQILKQGERLRLLGLLLAQMVCPLDRRLKDVDTVIRQLENIEAWEQNARQLPMSAEGLAGIEKLQQKAQETRRVTSENMAAREQERRALVDVKDSFEAWLGGELQKAAAHISSGGDLTCEVGEITLGNDRGWLAAYAHNRAYRPVGGLELRLEQGQDPVHRRHILQIRLCEDPGPLVTVTVQVGPQSDPVVASQPARDLQLAMIPCYGQTIPGGHPRQPAITGFVTAKSAVGKVRGQLAHSPGRSLRGRPTVSYERTAAVTQSFHTDVNLCTAFRASDWPGVMETLRVALTEAVDAFVTYIASGARGISQ